MNRLYFLLFVSFSALSLQAQTIFSDDFSSNNLPNWTVVNHYSGSAVLWKWNNGTSGGQASDQINYAGASTGCILVDSDGDGDTNGSTKEYTTITSKSIDCSTAPKVFLSFYEYYAKYQSDTPQVFISSDSVNWTLVYDPSIGFAQDETTNNPNLAEINVSSVATNQSKVYIRFSWKGTWDYWWFVDDVKLYVPSLNEVAATGFSNLLSNGCQLSNAEVFTITLKNKGLAAIDSVTAKYQVNALPVVSEKIILNTPLQLDSSYTYSFNTTADFSAAGNYNITAWIELPGDTINDNDTIGGFAISAAPSAIPYSMGFEVPTFGTEVGGLTWTTEDVNNDGFTWNLSANAPATGSVHFRYYYNFNNTSVGGNDWLFSPCLNLVANTAYKISFFEQVGISQGTVFNEKLELLLGNDNSPAAMTQSLVDFGELSNSDYEEKKVAYKPTTSGTSYLGFRCYSDPDAFYLDIDDVNISVLELPNAQFNTSFNGQTVNVIDASDELITDWQWSWGDGTTSTGQGPAPHTYATDGVYEICLIVNNLAGADTACKTVVISGLSDYQNSLNMVLYPNPTNHVVNILFQELLSSDAKLELMNSLGQIVFEKKVNNKVLETIDMTPFAQGLYYVKISSAETQSVTHFLYAK
ncbi:MAG: T9SS type A sorting domain-containing protein [Bacteroidetes bacterium]|nr:T9SS type A sorting domain-containing protein [Bacteroidota bacterium]